VDFVLSGVKIIQQSLGVQNATGASDGDDYSHGKTVRNMTSLATMAASISLGNF